MVTEARQRTWKGHPVPAIMEGWFDQMMQSSALICAGSADRYIDVTLTAAPGGKYAKPPGVNFK